MELGNREFSAGSALLLLGGLILGVANLYAVAVSFTADIGDFIVPVPTGSPATGTGTFELNAAMTELTYSMTFSDLDLKADILDRTEPSDVVAIHFHVGGPASVGHHVLNVFGVTLGAVHEDDGDLVIDYETETISGKWDDLDLSTGLPAMPSSKPLTSVLTELMAGEIYVNVHTNAYMAGEIRGQIAIVP